MSADNMIYIQQQNNGKWWVWMGFAGNEKPYADHVFDHKEDARDYAFEWYRKAAIIEYGVIKLKPCPPDLSNPIHKDWDTPEEDEAWKDL